MKKILLAAIIILLAAGGFFVWESKNHAPGSERLPRVSGSVIFNPKDVVVGDQYGPFRVTKVWYMAPVASYPHDIYSVVFDGTLTFTGTFVTQESGCFESLENVPTSTLEQLPRVDGDQIPSGVALDVGDIPRADLPSTGDKVEVTIDRFNAGYVPKECGGDDAHVTSIKTAAPVVMAALGESTSFDPKTVKVGDRVGNFVVSNISAAMSSAPLSRESNVRIEFTGTTTLQGKYSIGQMAAEDLLVITPVEAALLPHALGPSTLLCLGIPPTVQWNMQEGDAVKVVINEFDVTLALRDGCGYGASVASVSKL